MFAPLWNLIIQMLMLALQVITSFWFDNEWDWDLEGK